MIVADTNLLSYFLLPGPHTADASRCWQRDAHWVAPPLWESEFRSVLVQYIRAGRLTLPVAHTLFADALVLVEPREVQAEAVLDCAMAYGLSAYDAEFVALAEHLMVPLVSGDRRVCRACPAVARSLADFAAGR